MPRETEVIAAANKDPIIEEYFKRLGKIRESGDVTPVRGFKAVVDEVGLLVYSKAAEDIGMTIQPQAEVGDKFRIDTRGGRHLYLLPGEFVVVGVNKQGVRVLGTERQFPNFWKRKDELLAISKLDERDVPKHLHPFVNEVRKVQPQRPEGLHFAKPVAKK